MITNHCHLSPKSSSLAAADGPALKCAANTELSLVVHADGDTISVHCWSTSFCVSRVAFTSRLACDCSACHMPSSLLHEFAHINVTVTSEAIMKYSVYDVFA